RPPGAARRRWPAGAGSVASGEASWAVFAGSSASPGGACTVRTQPVYCHQRSTGDGAGGDEATAPPSDPERAAWGRFFVPERAERRSDVDHQRKRGGGGGGQGEGDPRRRRGGGEVHPPVVHR